MDTLDFVQTMEVKEQVAKHLLNWCRLLFRDMHRRFWSTFPLTRVPFREIPGFLRHNQLMKSPPGSFLMRCRTSRAQAAARSLGPCWGSGARRRQRRGGLNGGWLLGVSGGCVFFVGFERAWDGVFWRINRRPPPSFQQGTRSSLRRFE